MGRKAGNLFFRGIALGVALLLFTGTFLFASARVVRVAALPYEGFCDKQEDGAYGGFGADAIASIADLNEWSVEFVDSWDGKPLTLAKAAELAGEGKIDIVGPVRSDTGHTLAYPEYPLFEGNAILAVRKGDERYSFSDNSTIHDMKIGIVEGKVVNERLFDYVKENDLKGITYVPYASWDALPIALEKGDIDGAYQGGLSWIGENEILLLFKVGPVYFATGKENTEVLSGLNKALGFLANGNDHYLEELYHVYYQQSLYLAVHYTEEEKHYIKNASPLKVWVCLDTPGLGFRDDEGKLAGAQVEIMNIISKESGLRFSYVSDADCLAGKETNDLYALAAIDDERNRTAGIQASIPYLSMDICAVTRRNGNSYMDTSVRVAAVKDYFISDIVPQRMGYTDIVYCDTYKDCADAVEKGKADVTFVSNYMSEAIIRSGLYRNLSVAIMPDLKVPFGVSIKKGASPVLYGILYKTVQNLESDQVNDIIADQIALNLPKETFRNALTRSPLVFAVIGIILSVLIVVVVFLFVMARIRKHNAHVLEQQNRKLQDASEAKSRFLSRMSHDIRTPMNAILGFTGLAREVPGIPDEVDDYLEKVQNSGSYMLCLLNDILDMSKIESGKLFLKEEATDGKKFLSDIAEVHEAQATEKGIRLQCDFSKFHADWVRIDPLRNRQVFANLLSNAIKFSDNGSVIVWNVEDRPVDERHVSVISTVTDQGCGMSEEYQQKLFQPFEQERNQYTNTTTGSGLGLTIVKTIVDAMGGSICVESSIGKGSTFVVKLVWEKSDAKPELPKSDGSSADMESLKGKHILLAEDNKLNTILAQRLLERKGMNFQGVTDGKQAVELFVGSAKGTYDAILMDIRMPLMDGLEATRKIRSSSHPDAKDIPIIAMTADTFDESVKGCMAAGMNAHVAKPVDAEKLYEVLASCMKRRKGCGKA
jgi:signal transduction histidine kinase/ActR/RegA family two-component response regulator